MAVIAPKALRGPGTVGVTRTATAAQPGSPYVFRALMDAPDIQDVSLMLNVRLFLDARLVYSMDWTCGVKDRHGNPIAPFITYNCPEIPPTNFRVECDLPRPVNLGLDVTIQSPGTQIA